MTATGKIHKKPESGIQDHAASNQRKDPRAVSWEQLRMVQPDMLIECFHSQLEQLCSVPRLVRMPTMLHILKRPWGRADGRKDPLRGARPVSKDPSAGAQRGCANLGKLTLRQGLLIPWYREDRDCDYLRDPLVAALAANAVSPSSGPGSFAMASLSALYNGHDSHPLQLTDVSVRYAVIQ